MDMGGKMYMNTVMIAGVQQEGRVMELTTYGFMEPFLFRKDCNAG